MYYTSLFVEAGPDLFKVLENIFPFIYAFSSISSDAAVRGIFNNLE